MKIKLEDLENTSNYYWTCKDGKEICLKDLSDFHLANIIQGFNKQQTEDSSKRLPIFYYALQKERRVRLSEAAYKGIGLKLYEDDNKMFEGDITARFDLLLGRSPVHRTEIDLYEAVGNRCYQRDWDNLSIKEG